MFDILPFLMNNLLGNNTNVNGLNNNYNNNLNNNPNSNLFNTLNSLNNQSGKNITPDNNYQYNTYTNGSNIYGVFTSSFSGSFSGNLNNDFQGIPNMNGNNIIGGTIGGFGEAFSSIFNEVFNTLASNEGLINNIVDTVLNSEVVNNIIEAEEKLEEEEVLRLDFKDYGDRYLIEGKIEGVQKRDIDIDYDNEHISIKVNRNALEDRGKTINILEENNYIEKNFFVPNVDLARIQAVYNAEVLRVYLKKKPEVEEGTTIIDVDSYLNE